MLEPGGLVIGGIAVDSRATTGTGIDHVDFFLGNRNEGGINVGTTVPGAAPGPFGTFGSFQTTVQLPNMTGGNDLVGYAHSSVTGQEFVISVPIVVGETPTVAGETSANGAVPTITQTCSAAPSTTTPSTPAATTPSTTTPSTTTPSTTTTPAQSMVTLEIANPSPGASVLVGAYVTQGMAMDKAAMSGVGVDRIDIFLDNRDEGGTFLGSASLGAPNTTPGAWSTTITFPSNMKGLHALWYYAHSTVSGGETAMEIPVTIE